MRNCELPTDAIYFHIEQVRSRTKNNGEKFDASGDSFPLASNISPFFFENFIINSAIICWHGREKKISGKVKSSNRGRKKNSARPRLLLVCWRQTTFPITFPIDDWIKTMILVFHWYSIVSVLLCKIWIHFLWRKCEYVMEIFFQKVSIYLLWRKFYEFESVWWYIVQSD